MIPNRLKYMAAAALLSLCQPVLASDWQFLGNSTAPETAVFMDKDSIRFTGDTAKAWSKLVYAAPQELAGSYPQKTYQSIIGLSVYNCTAKTTSAKQMTLYATADGKGVVKSMDAKDSELEFLEVSPDSLGEALLDWVCQQKPRRR